MADGYIQVVSNMRYSESTGFGWSSGSAYALSRGGDPLTRDYNYTREAVFSVDLPNGEYEVAVTQGEALIAHDQMGLYLEGVQVDTVDTAAYEFVRTVHQVSISDGQLNLGLKDLGGSNVYALINALDVLYLGPDVNGPSVTATDPSGSVKGPIDGITVTFSEPIDANSFTLDDVLSLQGPSGAITPTAINQVAPGDFEILFDPQNTDGTYSLVIGADVTDIAGNPLDQDGDGVSGEAVDDQFAMSFVLEAGPELVAQLDFGTTYSPVALDHTRVSSSTRYDAAKGYGWLEGSVYSLNRGGNALTGDLNYTVDATFAFDLPSGEYEITITQGEAIIPHDEMAIFLEGVNVDIVASAKYQYVTNTYTTEVVDGQLTLRLVDLGGSNAWAVINALQIARVVGPSSANSLAIPASGDSDDGQADDESPLVPMNGVASSLPKAKASVGSLNASDRVSLFDAVMAQLGEETEEEAGAVDASVARNLESGLGG